MKQTMNISINNSPVVTEVATVGALAIELALPERGVALAVNNRVIPRAAWEETSLAEGDKVTIIKAAFGG